MSHAIIIIINSKNCVRQKAAQLSDYAEDLHELAENLTGKAQQDAHELLERTQDYLTALCNGTPTAEGITFDSLVGEMEAQLGI